MDPETSVNCPMCKRTTPVVDIRLFEGKRICASCYDKIHGKKLIIPQNKELKPKEKSRQNEIKFTCNSCNYSFYRPEDFEKKHVCPFCGERGTIQRETTSRDIIASVSKKTEIVE